MIICWSEKVLENNMTSARGSFKTNFFELNEVKKEETKKYYCALKKNNLPFQSAC